MRGAAIAALLAVDPAGLGGVALRSEAGVERDAWLALLRTLLPAALPMRRIPLHIDDSRLLGGLDLPATLRTGRPVALAGLLAQTDGGLAVLPSAERLSTTTAARLARVLDCGEVVMERHGLSMHNPAHLGLVALDEGASDDEQLPAALLDRLAFHTSLKDDAFERHVGSPRDAEHGSLHERRFDNDPLETLSAEPLDGWGPEAVHAARGLLPRVTVPDDVLHALCASALALGIDSPRAPLLALRAARAAAALDGRSEAGSDDARLAAMLVLAPRATRLPSKPGEEPQEQDAAAAPETPATQHDATPPQAAQGKPDAPDAASDPGTPVEPQAAPTDRPTRSDPGVQELEEQVLQAAQAAIPAGLLATLQVGPAGPSRSSSSGAGSQSHSNTRGQPTGARRGDLRAGARLNIIETLRAAAPWQTLRRRELAEQAARLPGEKPAPVAGRIQVRREDFHVSRFKQQRQTTTIFVVDASGSSALHRLAEAKGAVELLLADCYVRRDRVAMLAFRGKTCELLLPPTRSLVRAKRSLAVLPGGGGTPLAAGLDMARELALACNRRGETPIIVVLTDARANIARDGSPGREAGVSDALASARTLRAAALPALLLDTSPRAQPAAQEMANAMGATYLPLPHAGATLLSQAVRSASAAASRQR